MKYLKQFGIILMITALGEILRYLLPLPIPASIYGLLLMLFFLCTKIIKLEDVKSAADFLVAIMPVMFIPSAAGLIDSWEEFQPILLPGLATTLLSTLFVLLVTGKTADFLLEGEQKDE